MSAWKPWTSRDVRFEAFPCTSAAEFEALVDAAVDLYWSTWRHRIFGTLPIAAQGMTLIVGGWPRWVPKAYARRSVARLAYSRGVGGDAEFHTLRSVLA